MKAILTNHSPSETEPHKQVVFETRVKVSPSAIMQSDVLDLKDWIVVGVLGTSFDRQRIEVGNFEIGHGHLWTEACLETIQRQLAVVRHQQKRT